MPYDLIIKNCPVIDGTGDDRYTGSVGVKDGLIAKIWRGEPTDNEAAETVYGEGRILCPGFVDIHSHSDTTILRYPEAESRILQGITTELGGNCGISAAPVNPRFRDSLEYYLRESLEAGSLEWESFDEYLRLVEKKKPSVDIASIEGFVHRGGLTFKVARAVAKQAMIPAKGFPHRSGTKARPIRPAAEVTAEAITLLR